MITRLQIVLFKNVKFQTCFPQLTATSCICVLLSNNNVYNSGLFELSENVVKQSVILHLCTIKAEINRSIMRCCEVILYYSKFSNIVIRTYRPLQHSTPYSTVTSTQSQPTNTSQLHPTPLIWATIKYFSTGQVSDHLSCL